MQHSRVCNHEPLPQQYESRLPRRNYSTFPLCGTVVWGVNMSMLRIRGRALRPQAILFADTFSMFTSCLILSEEQAVPHSISKCCPNYLMVVYWLFLLGGGGFYIAVA